jgi:hypothetical protein
VIRQHLPLQPLKWDCIFFFRKVGFLPTRCHNTKEDNLKNHLHEILNNFISVIYGEEELPTSTLNLKAVYPPPPKKKLRKCLEEYAVSQTEILQPDNSPK